VLAVGCRVLSAQGDPNSTRRTCESSGGEASGNRRRRHRTGVGRALGEQDRLGPAPGSDAHPPVGLRPNTCGQLRPLSAPISSHYPELRAAESAWAPAESAPESGVSEAAVSRQAGGRPPQGRGDAGALHRPRLGGRPSALSLEHPRAERLSRERSGAPPPSLTEDLGPRPAKDWVPVTVVVRRRLQPRRARPDFAARAAALWPRRRQGRFCREARRGPGDSGDSDYSDDSDDPNDSDRQEPASVCT
jgi:hypothetical protein